MPKLIASLKEMLLGRVDTIEKEWLKKGYENNAKAIQQNETIAAI